MKRIAYRITALGLAALLVLPALSGCDITELNRDPNEPTDATTPFLLTNAQTELADTYWGIFPLGYFGNLNAQYWSQTQYTSESRYDRREGVVDGMWSSYYLILNDLQQIIRLNRQRPEEFDAYGPNANQIAIAKIMQVWIYQLLTDLWGPVPFFEALKGAGGTTPPYTDQSEIYPALIDTLTAASEMIILGEPALAGGDIIYGGDMSKWKRFANSLKMRVAIRMSAQLPDQAATAIQEALASGVFQSNADNALIPFSDAEPYLNPIYVNYEISGRDDWAVSDRLLGLMNSLQDPRRAAYAEEGPGGGFGGYPYGLEGGTAQALYRGTTFSRPSLRVRRPDAAAFLMLYDEVLFIKAEAAERGFIPGGTVAARRYFQQAIEASMHFWGVTDQNAIDAYLDRVSYSSANWQQVIGTQKWLALYMQGFQGWSVWRRLDFTGVLAPPEGGTIPEFGLPIAVRVFYPLNEETLNNENVNQAVQNLLRKPEDTQGTRVWWDVAFDY